MIHSTLNSVKILTIISGLLMLSACSSHDQSVQNKEQAVTVILSTPTQNTSENILLSGRLESENTATLSTRVMGYISSFKVKTGDHVSKGALLAIINSQDIIAKRAQASSIIAEAEAAARNASRDYARYQALYNQQSVSAKELENVSLQNTSAQAKLEAARQMRNEVNAMLTYTQIRAPFSGVITQKLADEGSMASPGMPLLILEQGGNLRVSASVPEGEITQIRVGDEAVIDIKATGKQLTGKIVEMSPSSASSGGQYLIRVSIPSSAQKGLLSGMYANITIAGKIKKNISTGNLQIPLSSIVTRDQLNGVYVVNDNHTVSLRWLRIGKVSGTMVDVLAGLSANERYVVRANGKLYNGAPFTEKK